MRGGHYCHDHNRLTEFLFLCQECHNMTKIPSTCLLVLSHALGLCQFSLSDQNASGLYLSMLIHCKQSKPPFPLKLEAEFLPILLKVLHYSWGTSTTALGSPPDVIVGADLLYAPENHKLLLDSLRQLCASHTLIFLAFRFRGLFDTSFLVTQSHILGIARPPKSPKASDVQLTICISDTLMPSTCCARSSY